MKYVFLCLFAALIVASVGTYYSLPDTRSNVPVLYWVTDANPARGRQIELFHQWMLKHAYCDQTPIATMAELESFRARGWSPALVSAMSQATSDGQKLWDPATTAADLPLEARAPWCELRADTANKNTQKMVIQGVSGVAGDIMDIPNIRYFEAMGLLEDVTTKARELRFDPSYTYPAIEPDITVDGAQYTFPCNVYCHNYWINKTTFARCGQPLPPLDWDFTTFERLGKEFVKAANPPGQRQTVFFTDRANVINVDVMRRSLGLSVFDETMTRCALDDPRAVRVFELLRKWTLDDHIMPSAADEAGFATDPGYGGVAAQLFNSGKYAMYRIDRYVLIQLRKFGQLQLAVSHLPCDEFPNTITGTRAAGVYSGSKHKDLAVYFLAYLASADYNMQIVDDADALPPNPKYTETELFLRPPNYPNEWGCHEVSARAAETIAITRSQGPFVLDATVGRLETEALDNVLAERLSPERAAREEAQKINDEIQRQLQEKPSLRAEYDRLVAVQQQIEQRRAEGRKVPEAWITNPFHRRYYAFKGWLE